MEQLLHYVWRYKIFPLKPLQTTSGLSVEVLDPGLPNRNAGPDFSGAKVRIDGILWVGNVEIHTRASDWMRHGHQHDPAYDSVILHVVETADVEVCRPSGDPIPQLCLTCPEEVSRRYDELRFTEMHPPCYAIIPSLSQLKISEWLSALVAERYDQRAATIGERLGRTDFRWDDAFMVTLARGFGFGVNGDAFEAWAQLVPFRAVDHHRDDLLQVEAIFFGQAGLLEGELEGEGERDEYFLALQKEYRYLRRKFNMPDPLSAGHWRLLRLRPSNFPHVRLAQLAWLYHKHGSLFPKLMEVGTLDEARNLLTASTSPYWDTHFRFGRKSPTQKKCMGRNGAELLMINAVIPFIYTYGRHRAQEESCERAGQMLEALPAEKNYIIQMWDGAGLHVHNAAESQALMQLQRKYCDRKDCLRCRFGYEFLKRRSS